MTTPVFHAQVPPESDRAKRVFIAIGGLLLLAVGAVITLGSELVGVAAIAIAWFVVRRRKGRLTRTKAWFISVGATAIPFLVLFAVGLMSAPKLTPEERRLSLAEARARRDSLPAWMKGPAQQQQTSAVVDSLTQKLVENRGFMVWIAAMGALIVSGMGALFAGTIGWGATMLLFRAVTDEWMGSVAAPAAEGVAEPRVEFD
jgi:hypothetical protein